MFAYPLFNSRNVRKSLLLFSVSAIFIGLTLAPPSVFAADNSETEYQSDGDDLVIDPIRPKNGATVDQSNLKFIWKKRGKPVKVYYLLEIFADGGGSPSDILIFSSETDRNQFRYTDGNLKPGQTYWWRVLVMDNYGAQTPWQEFTMADRAPARPSAVSPANEAIVEAGAVTLQASAFSDPDGDDHAASHWRIRRADQVYDAPGQDASFHVDMTEGDLTRHSVSGLVSGMKYAWKVGYENAVGNTTWSGEYFFKVGTLSSDAVTIPAGTTVEDFTIAAFTAWPASPDAETALKIDYDDTMYRIGTYDPVSGAYIECGSGLTIEPGRAYWFLSREGMNAGIDGVPVSKTEDIEVKLGYNAGSGNGWNMISPPNAAKYYWDDLQVVVYDPEDGSVIDGPTSISRFPDDYIDLRIWRWENGGYVSASVGEMFKLNHHQGYWVKAIQPNVSLIFDHSVQTARLPTRDRMLAAAKHHLNRLIEESIFSPASAFAAGGDSPPAPMAAFGGSTGYTKTAGGGCFLDTAASGSYFESQKNAFLYLFAAALLIAATACGYRRLKGMRS